MTNITRRSYPNCPEIAEHQHKMLEGNIISPCECWVTVIRGRYAGRVKQILPSQLAIQRTCGVWGLASERFRVAERIQCLEKLGIRHRTRQRVRSTGSAPNPSPMSASEVAGYFQHPSSERRLPVLSAKIAMRYKTICLGLREYDQ